MNCSLTFPSAERWRKYAFCIQSNPEQLNDKKTFRKNPEVAPQSLYPLTGTVWVRSLSNRHNYSGEACSQGSDVTSVDSHSTFCSNICNLSLLGFCPSIKLRAIKATWVTRMIPSTGVVITSNVITIITVYDDKKP